MGCDVIGLDFSATAIDYASRQAARMIHQPRYRVADYLDWQERECYDRTLLIYEDFGVLPPAQRQRLLANIHCALRPGGLFALDVAGLAAYRTLVTRPARDWELCGDGFWRSHEHLVLHERFLYPDIPATCDQYAIVDNHTVIYRIYQTYYTPETIVDELERSGFAVEDVFSSLNGQPWDENSGQIGIVCRKA